MPAHLGLRWVEGRGDRQTDVDGDGKKVGLVRTVYTLYMIVYLVISLPKIPYIHRTYIGLAGKSRSTRSYMVHIYGPGQVCICTYGSGQPYKKDVIWVGGMSVG